MTEPDYWGDGNYTSYEELIAAEANGYMVIAIITKGKRTWPAAEGPYPDKKEAHRAAARIRNRWKRTAKEYPGTTYTIHVRAAWKRMN